MRHVARLVIPDPARTRILVREGAASPTLPLAESQAEFRSVYRTAAPWLNATVHERFGLRATTLRCVRLLRYTPNNVVETLFDMESHDVPGALPAGVRWLDLADARQLPERERALVDAWAEDAPLRAPWCRPGWYADAVSWARAQLERAGRRIDGAPEQIRQWDISSIIRVPTMEGNAYLKAVPAYFSHEGDVLRAIRSLAPDELPRVIADDPARHWTLFDEIDGASLRGQDDGHAADALALLARLQVAAIPRAERLLRACSDRRLDHLTSEAAWLLARPGLADSVDAATWTRCTAFVQDLERHVGELRACAVPETLVHGDFHLGNVATEAGRLTLFDWTDACVSHPLFDLATVFYDETQEDAIEAYVREWSAIVPADRLRRALPLADALACIHHAVSYERISEGMEPGARWQVAGATQGWLRRLAERAP